MMMTIKGGGWSSKPMFLRYVYRRDFSSASYFIGFRLIQEYTKMSNMFVLRGGSWNSRPEYLRSVTRYRDNADVAINFIGIRLVQEEN